MYSQTFKQAQIEAIKNPNIMPDDCLDLLEKYYGKRMDHMRPSTITKMVCSLMQTAVDIYDDLEVEIKEKVNDWCNTF